MTQVSHIVYNGFIERIRSTNDHNQDHRYLLSAPSLRLRTPACRNRHPAGNCTVGPLSPVEIAGAPQPTPPPEVFTSRGLEIYPEGSTKLFTKLSFSADGTYSVQLPVGNYTVQLPPGGIEFAKGLPAVVTIKSGEVTTLDINIDTGIR